MTEMEHALIYTLHNKDHLTFSNIQSFLNTIYYRWNSLSHDDADSIILKFEINHLLYLVEEVISDILERQRDSDCIINDGEYGQLKYKEARNYQFILRAYLNDIIAKTDK